MPVFRRVSLISFLLLITVLIISLVPLNPGKDVFAQTSDDYVTDVRFIEANDLGLQRPGGLTFWPGQEALVVLEAAQTDQESQKTDIFITTLYEDLLGISQVDAHLPERLNVVVDSQSENLLLLNPETQELVQIKLPSSDSFAEALPVVERFDMSAYGVHKAQGMTLDRDTNRLFILDAQTLQIIVITADSRGRFDGGDEAVKSGRVQQIPLPQLQGTTLRGLAFDPYSKHLYVLDTTNQMLVELSDKGAVISQRSLTFLELANSQAMVFGPSSDLTDDPKITNLYLADAGRDLNGNWVDAKIVELSLIPPVLMTLPELSMAVSLIQTIDTSLWSPPSPDPAGVDYHPTFQRLVVSDSEVDEMPIYAGANIFLSQTNGNLTHTCTTLPFSKEPTGLAINPANGHIFISDDGPERVYEINIGVDNTYCTGDDIVTSISTRAFNSRDPEGVAFGQGHLFVADGGNAQIYRVSPGANGIFDGVPPAGDDQVTDFDTASMGLRDPEGIGFHHARGTLFIVSRKDKILVETTVTGTVLQVHDIRFLNAVSPGGVGTGPSSQNPATTNIFVAARGVDNNSDPNENDGKVYELSLDGSPPPATATPSGPPTATPPPTATLPPTVTPTPSASSVYLSFTSNLTMNGLEIRDEDIAYFDGSNWSLFFDGSDVGVSSADLDAFDRIGPDTFLMSFNSTITLADAGIIEPTDVVLFQATSVGANTAGTFSLYFDGSDVGLETSGERIDALMRLPDGQLLVSFKGNYSMTGVSGNDEDLVIFAPVSLGSNTSGTWSLYFDGSDVGLDTSSDEDINGVNRANNGDIYLTTLGAFAVAGVSGGGEDIFVCSPISVGDVTSCTFAPTLFFDGSTLGLTGQSIDAFDLP